MARTGRPREPLLQRLFKSMKVDAGTGCWVWLGTTTLDGYGQIKGEPPAVGEEALTLKVHRVAYEELVGAIGKGLELDHLCRCRQCFNPDHLEPVTSRVNVLRSNGVAALNARASHCVSGHAFDEKNTHHRPTGQRMCRECSRIQRAEYRARTGV